MSVDLTLVQKIAIWALPVLFAITLHEVAHGYVARLLGDRTAEAQGRLSLNPIRHVDPVGTLLVPAVLLALGGFLFGWARPVPVSTQNLRRPRRDMALVAIAGPGANAFMALLWGLLLKVAASAGQGEGVWLGVQYMALAGISINLVLMVLNLLPLPALDGSRVLAALLPEAGARTLDRLEPYGLVIVIALLATGILSKLMMWPLLLSERGLMTLLGMHPSSFF